MFLNEIFSNRIVRNILLEYQNQQLNDLINASSIDDARSVVSKMENNGFLSFVNSGRYSNVYAIKNDKRNVIKVSHSFEDGFYDYARLTTQVSNRHFPKVKLIKKFPQGYGYTCIVEKLNFNEQKVVKAFGFNVWENRSADYDSRLVTLQEQIISYYEDNKPHIQYLQDFINYIGEDMAKAIHSVWGLHKTTGHGLDMHLENWGVRTDGTLIISDPLSSSNKLL